MSNEITKPTRGVFYTDGGCDNPKVAGWGIHGYLFHDAPSKIGTGNAKALVSAEGYKMGESGKPDITLTHYIDAFGSITEGATNNVAELSANLYTLKMIKDTGVKQAMLIMDSQYVLQGFDKWMDSWRKANWIKKDGQPVINKAIWSQVFDLKKELVDSGVDFTTAWVKGHSGNVGNERADGLATAGKMAARNGHPRESFKIVDAKGFWSAKSERNRMFSWPNWYFNANTTNQADAPGGRYSYYIGTIRESIELIGKSIADASFAVLFLKERDPVLDVVKEGTHDLHVGRPQGVMVAYLDQIFKPAVYDDFNNFGRDLLIKDRRQRHLSTKDKQLVLHEADPPGLSFRLMDHLGLLEDRLRDYLKADPKSHLRTTDLTDLLYEQTETKKKVTVKLRNTITSGTRSLKVSGNYRSEKGEDKTMSIVLTLAQDLPDRNTLAALAAQGIKASLITWPESARAVRYAIVIESNDDVGIWAGPYSNLQILPLK